MELRVLKYFLAIADEGNMTKAATILHITQPTLSKQLAQLEEELDTKLFDRTSRQMVLTNAGLLLRDRAREILKLTHKTMVDIHQTDSQIQGEIIIGSGESHAFKILAKLIQEINLKHPDIKYDIYSGNAIDVSEKLDKGLLDFGLVIGTPNLEKYNAITLQTSDSWGVLMRQDHPTSQHKSITPDLLAKLPLIISKQALDMNELTGWLGQDFDPKLVVATYNLINNAALMVSTGLGFALTLDKLVNTSGESELCFRPLSPKLEANLYLIWQKHHPLSPAASIFLNEFKAQSAL